MRSVGMRPVVVHGGGPQIGELMARLGKVPEFRRRPARHRRRDARHRPHGARRQGQPRHRVRHQRPRPARRRPVRRGRRPDHRPPPARPSSASSATSTPSTRRSSSGCWPQDLIPVVATIGSDVGGQAYNINADTAAGAIAEALGAEKLVYLTDVEGLRRDAARPRARLISTIDGRRARGHDRRRAALEGGMIPKVDVVRARGAQAASATPTSSTGACPTRCCSRSSPPKASAPW